MTTCLRQTCQWEEALADRFCFVLEQSVVRSRLVAQSKVDLLTMVFVGWFVG